MREGKAREMGRGSADPDGPRGRVLAQAREAADGARKLLREGRNPVERRQAEVRARAEAEARGQTFRTVAEQFLASHAAGWRDARRAEQWRTSVETYANPLLGDMEIATIGTNGLPNYWSMSQRPGANGGLKTAFAWAPPPASRRA